MTSSNVVFISDVSTCPRWSCKQIDAIDCLKWKIMEGIDEKLDLEGDIGIETTQTVDISANPKKTSLVFSSRFFFSGTFSFVYFFEFTYMCEYVIVSRN